MKIILKMMKKVLIYFIEKFELKSIFNNSKFLKYILYYLYYLFIYY